MACEEHQRLANIIKEVHLSLRDTSEKLGFDIAWQEHLKNTDKLTEYAASMKQLASTYWQNNANDKTKSASSRIDWVIQYCYKYFLLNSADQETTEKVLINHFREKELNVFNSYFQDYQDLQPEISELKVDKIKCLDVGSCYNPFNGVPSFIVTAIDIAPAIESVKRCDFLNLSVVEQSKLNENDGEIKELCAGSYDVIVFSLFLEYLPSSQQRIECCKKAYDLLRTEGILFIITPDSRHANANAKLIKNWRYTLGLLGFTRIKYTKLSHLSCMVFRKATYKCVAVRWSTIHKEPYMTSELNIPQDFNTKKLANAVARDDDSCSCENDILFTFNELPNYV